MKQVTIDMPDESSAGILRSEGAFGDHCLIGIDYDEFEPDTYRAVVVESPKAIRRWATGDVAADLTAALLWFAQHQPTQVLAFRSSVTHYFQDVRIPSRRRAS